MLHIFAAAGLVAALVSPATAGAARQPVRSTPAATRTTAPVATAPTLLSAAAAVGRRYWGTSPCNGAVRLVAQSRLAPGLSSTTDAWVTFGSALGANNLAAPAGSYTNCAITFARWRWPTAESMQQDWDLLCTTMVHELGHLLGRTHDSTPGSVMAPVFTDLSSEPSLCRTSRPVRSAR